MASNERTTLAPQTDRKEWARIVKQINEIERTNFLAWDELSEVLMTRVAEAMKKAVPEPWQVVGGGADASLISPDWRSTRGLGRGDAWFQMEEVVTDENEHSWIAAATGAPGTGMCLELFLRNGLPNFDGILAANSGTATQLLSKGFEQADGGKRLFMSVLIDREALAKAFETDKFDEAMTPVRSAVEKIIAAKGELDGLLGLIRRKGKPQ